MSTIKIVTYLTNSGKEPYVDWLETLDSVTKAIIRTRVNRVRLGNFGDCKAIKGAKSLWELRIDHGPGYRVYYGKLESTIVVLLIGGNKKSQDRDIQKAQKYWLSYKEIL